MWSVCKRQLFIGVLFIDGPFSRLRNGGRIKWWLLKAAAGDETRQCKKEYTLEEKDETLRCFLSAKRGVDTVCGVHGISYGMVNCALWSGGQLEYGIDKRGDVFEHSDGSEQESGHS